MTYPVRCNRHTCRKRKTLRHPIGYYLRTPGCECGGGLHHDKWVRGPDRKRTCHCGGVPYPHNRHHIDCSNYVGQRDKVHEEILKDLGATPVTDYNDGSVPF